MLALCLLTVVAATGDVTLADRAPRSARLAAEASFLPGAPTSPEVALASSIGVLSTGVVMSAGFAVLLATAAVTPALGSIGLLLGVALINFGPNTGDLLNGEAGRFLLHGLARSAVMVLSAIVLPLFFYWVAMIAGDVVASWDAPKRWAQRQAALAAPRDGQRQDPPWTIGNLLSLSF